MRKLYIDCSMGAAGDMLMGALYELLETDAKSEFLKQIAGLREHGVTVEPKQAVKCGITGTHMDVRYNNVSEEHVIEERRASHEVHEHHHDHGDEQEHSHGHEEHCHSHEHHHSHEEHGHHQHTSYGDICTIIDSLPIEKGVADRAKSVYRLIAEAESKVHGRTVDSIHFHEVGSMDAVADVVGVCMLVDYLKADVIVASPVHVGSGHVHCAHGILPVPAPATAEILKGIPIYGGNIKSELCTPTGAALLKCIADEFADMNLMAIEKIGRGMGNKDFEVANCVTVYMGVTKDSTDSVVELRCNIDDDTAEDVGFAVERIMAGKAIEVYVTGVHMKKNRPGVVMTVLCRPGDVDECVRDIFRYTTTIGVRRYDCERYVLDRMEYVEDTKYGPVRAKRSMGYGVDRCKLEYEDLAAIAKERGVSVAVVREEIKEK